VVSPLYHPPPKPPGIYRAARALRRVSLVILVVLILFVAFVAYSAVEVARTGPRVGSATDTLEANDTIELATSLSLSNPSLLPIQNFGLEFRILNASGGPIVDSTVGPASVPGGGSTTLPVDLFIPITAQGESLLTENQYLQWNVWGNASYGYLFSISLGVQTQKAWGAPFDNLTITVGAPFMQGGTTVVPVTLSFTDNANFADDGTLSFEIVPPSGPDCGSGAFALDVPPGTPYSNTQNVGVTAGCNPSGGTVDSQFVGSGIDVTLPPEAIP
jgi:hypothetical protein